MKLISSAFAAVRVSADFVKTTHAYSEEHAHPSAQRTLLTLKRSRKAAADAATFLPAVTASAEEPVLCDSRQHVLDS